MYGTDIALTAGGGTVNLSALPGSPDEYIVTGSATLAGSWTIQLDPAETPLKWKYFVFHYNATILLSVSNVTFFGTALTKEQAAKKSLIVCIYDGAAWNVKVLIDSSSIPGASAGTTSTALTAGGGTINLDPDRDTIVQILTGTPVLVGSWVVQGSGTPVEGDRFMVIYTATSTIGANSITIFSQVLSTSQALGGDCVVYAVYSGAAGGWKSILIEGSEGHSYMYEYGSAGTESCTRTNSTTSNDATGNYAQVSGGQSNTASGAHSVVPGGQTNTASGAHSNIGGGQTNTASGTHSNTGGGSANTASANYSNVGGGQTNTASGLHSVVGGGSTNTASGQYSSIPGGISNSAKATHSLCEGSYAVVPSNLPGAKATASNKFGTISGASQSIEVPLQIATTDATATDLQLVDGTTGVTIPTDCSANVYIQLIAVQTGGAAGTIGDTYSQNIKLAVANVAGVSTVIATSAVTLANYSTVTANVLYELPFKTAAPSMAVAVSVSVAANKIQINVTGEVNKNISWRAVVYMNWIGYRNFTV
jgi:hypothetical protein